MLSQPITLDPSYFTLEMYQGTILTDGTSVEFVETDLGYEPCDVDKKFLQIGESLLKSRLQNIYCPKNKDFTIAGNYIADNYKFVSVKLRKCQTGCQPDNVIEGILKHAYFSLIIQNSYVDFEDYDTPVKSYLDDRYLFKGMPGYSKEVKLYLKENEVELTDSLIPLGQTHKQEFINVDRADIDIQVLNGERYFNILFLLSPERIIYTRDVFSFFDLFGLLGGIFELLSISLGLIVGIFSKHTFLFSIFKRLYQTNIQNNHEKYQNSIDKDRFSNNLSITPFEECKSNRKKESKKNLAQQNIKPDTLFRQKYGNKSVPDFRQRIITDDSSILGDDGASGIAMNNLPREEEKSMPPDEAHYSENMIQDEQVDQLKSELDSRRKYNTSFCQKVVSMLSPVLLCKTKKQKDSTRQYHSAETKYNQELDCVEIVKSIREMKVVTKMILDQHQLHLLAFSKHNVISTHP